MGMQITIDVFDNKDVKKAVRETQLILKEMTEFKGKIYPHAQEIETSELHQHGYLKIKEI